MTELSDEHIKAIYETAVVRKDGMSPATSEKIIDALTAAQAEIERLRDDNRELNFYREVSAEPVVAWETVRGHELKIMSLESEIMRLRDNPEFDCTDAAHPAWWRGQEHAVRVMCQLVTDLLDGEEPSGVCNEPWETVRQRIAALVKQTVDYHDRPTGPGRWVCMSKPWADGKMSDVVVDLSQDDLDRGAPFHTARVYGPLPVDTKGQS